MNETELQQQLQQIRDLRQTGVITPRQAYERHVGLLDALADAAPAAQPALTPVAARAPPAPIVYRQPGLGLHLLALLFAISGGLLGVAGAIVQEVQSGGLFVAFTAAPIIEEALKPAGIYILLLWRPQALAGQRHIAVLTALSGLCFGLIESFVYVKLYFPEGGSDYVLFRFTVPVLMHVTCSLLVGLGLNRSVFDWAAGRTSLPRRTINFYIVAVVIHALYNITATVLALSGVLSFD